MGKVPDESGLWATCSFQGHGMVLCWMCAKALVCMMQSSGNDLKNWFPDAFRITRTRIKKPFTGRLHTSAGWKADIEPA